MFNGKGKVHYDDKEGFRVTLEVEQGLANYYYSFIPKSRRSWKPGWPAHITVVRPEKEIPPRIRYWGDYEGEEVDFIYDYHILEGNGYFWLNAWSKRLEVIRDELGLQNFSSYSLKPTGYNKTFHITIGKYDQVFDDANKGPEP